MAALRVTMTKLVIEDHGHENYLEGLRQGFFFGLFVAAIIVALVSWSQTHNQPLTPTTFIGR
jgi:hypothetical protein